MREIGLSQVETYIYYSKANLRVFTLHSHIENVALSSSVLDDHHMKFRKYAYAPHFPTTADERNVLRQANSGLDARLIRLLNIDGSDN